MQYRIVLTHTWQNPPPNFRRVILWLKDGFYCVIRIGPIAIAWRY